MNQGLQALDVDVQLVLAARVPRVHGHADQLLGRRRPIAPASSVRALQASSK
jgi:hypothetical protein